MAKRQTEVHTGKGGPITSQATLVVTEIGDSINLSTYGEGDCREFVDAVLEAMHEMMRSDPDFKFAK